MKRAQRSRFRPLILLFASLWSVQLLAQSTPPPAAGSASDPVAEQWDRVFRSIQLPEVDLRESFMARSVERLFREGRLAPGKSALVLAMGDGRNAFRLAELGLAVTGIDISGVALEQARSAAAERQLEIETIRADLFRYDLGRESWDLVTNVYFNPSLYFFERVMAAVRPGGFLLVEGYGSDYTGPGPAQETRYRPNQLLFQLASWRILEYQDGIFRSDWAAGRSVPVVRVLAQKP